VNNGPYYLYGEKMNPKPRPNHRLYVEALHKMTLGKRSLKAFELSSFSNRLFVHGARKKSADRLDKWPVSINGGLIPNGTRRASDGQRFVVVQYMDDRERIPTINVVENWIKEFGIL